MNLAKWELSKGPLSACGLKYVSNWENVNVLPNIIRSASLSMLIYDTIDLS